MVSTSSITMQSLGEIIQRAPAVGAKMWCLSVFYGGPWVPKPRNVLRQHTIYYDNNQSSLRQHRKVTSTALKFTSTTHRNHFEVFDSFQIVASVNSVNLWFWSSTRCVVLYIYALLKDNIYFMTVGFIVSDRRLAVARTSSEYVLQQRHLLCYESEPIP